MIIKRITYKPFQSKLKKPFRSSTTELGVRNGIYLIIEDIFGKVGLGEISPLPGFSKENLEETERDITRCIEILKGKELDEKKLIISDFLNELNLVNSARFGVEQALLDLLLQTDPTAIINELNLVQQKTISVNSVIGILKKETLLAELSKQLKSSYTTIKVKVGRENFENDFEILKMIRNICPENIQIRLDANRTWDADTALKNIERLSQFNIQYIEEPCEHLDCLAKLSHTSPIPIALDESISDINVLDHFITNQKFNFLVIKPMVIGSVFKIIKLIKKAEEKNINLIISSAFETAIGRKMLLLISSLVKHNYAHGLSTAEYFENELINDPFPVKNCKIDFILSDFTSAKSFML